MNTLTIDKGFAKKCLKDAMFELVTGQVFLTAKETEQKQCFSDLLDMYEKETKADA